MKSVGLRGTLRRNMGTFRPNVLRTTRRGVLCMSRIGLLSSRVMSVLLSITTVKIGAMRQRKIDRSRPSHFVLMKAVGPRRNSLEPRLLSHFKLSIVICKRRSPTRHVRMVGHHLTFNSGTRDFMTSCGRSRHDLRRHLLRTHRMLPNVVPSSSILLRVTDVDVNINISKRHPSVVVVRATHTRTTFRDHGRVATRSLGITTQLTLGRHLHHLPFRRRNCSRRHVSAIMSTILRN